MKIFNENHEVIGKVVQEENSWVAYWLVPSGFCNEGIYKFVGEYNSFNLAQYKLNEFLHNRGKLIEIDNIKFEQNLKMWEVGNKVIATVFICCIFVIFIILGIFIFNN